MSETIDKEYGIEQRAASGAITKARLCQLSLGSRLHLTHITSEGRHETACGKPGKHLKTRDYAEVGEHELERSICPTCIGAVMMKEEKEIILHNALRENEALREQVAQLKEELVWRNGKE